MGIKHGRLVASMGLDRATRLECERDLHVVQVTRSEMRGPGFPTVAKSKQYAHNPRTTWIAPEVPRTAHIRKE